MTIGYDISQTGSAKAGCGVVAAQFLQAFERLDPPHEFLLYPVVGDFYYDPEWRRRTARPRRLRARRWSQPATPLAAIRFWTTQPDTLDERLGRPDLLHLHSFFAPPAPIHARLVWTLHDLDFLRHPEWSEEANRIGCFQGVLNASLHADLIVAVSEYSRAQFLDAFPHYPPARVVVVPLASRFPEDAPRVARPRELAGLPAGEFILSVATLQPRKNLPVLVRGWSALRERHPGAPALVLAGARGWLNAELEALLAKVPQRDGILPLGYVSDQALLWLYRHCHAFVLPSLSEGFGLPALEAMSQGAPVVLSRGGSLPEIGGDAALYFDPRSAEGLTSCLEQLWLDAASRSALARAGARRAAKVHWDESARKLLALYEETVRQPRYAPPAAPR